MHTYADARLYASGNGRLQLRLPVHTYGERDGARSFHVGDQGPRKNSGSHIDASHSRQPLVKGERLVRYEVNAVMLTYTPNSR